MPTLTPQDFVNKWKRAEARERRSVQEYIIDICALVVHETPMQQHPTWSELAHKKLDQAVFAACGWKSDLSDARLCAALRAPDR